MSIENIFERIANGLERIGNELEEIRKSKGGNNAADNSSQAAVISPPPSKPESNVEAAPVQPLPSPLAADNTVAAPVSGNGNNVDFSSPTEPSTTVTAPVNIPKDAQEMNSFLQNFMKEKLGGKPDQIFSTMGAAPFNVASIGALPVEKYPELIVALEKLVS